MSGVVIDPEGELSLAARDVLADLAKGSGEISDWSNTVDGFSDILAELVDKGFVEMAGGWFNIVDVETPISEAEANEMANAAALSDMDRARTALIKATEPTNKFDTATLMTLTMGDPRLEYDWQFMADLGITDPVLGRHIAAWLQVAQHAVWGDVPPEAIVASARAIGTLVAARLAVKA